MAKQKNEKPTFQEMIDALEEKYGLKRKNPKELTVTSTGSLQLDQAMDIGGTPLGKMIELYGPMSAGKSTLMLHQIVEYQKAFPERRVALFDYEYSFNKKYAIRIGVDIEKLLFYQPTTLEEGFDMILGLIDQDLVSCVIIDSQTAAKPKAILEGEMGDATIGLQARLNSKFCLKVKGLLSIHKTTLFIVSQTRKNIGGMGGDPTVTTGGEAIKFYSDVRWKVWKMNDRKEEMNKTTVDVEKSKVGNPHGQAKFNISWKGAGIDKLGEVIDYAEEFKIIIRGGSWYSYEGTKLSQGLANLKLLLSDNPELLEEITKKVMDKLFVEKVTADVIEEVIPTDDKEE
jgi:recombination protein RecA